MTEDKKGWKGRKLMRKAKVRKGNSDIREDNED